MANNCSFLWSPVIQRSKQWPSYCCTWRDWYFIFALSHVHYACWVSVFTQDLKSPPLKIADLNKDYKDDYFVVNARGNTFSKTSINLSQKHNNKTIMSISDYTDQANTEEINYFFKKLNSVELTGIWMILRALLNVKVTKRSFIHSLVSKIARQVVQKSYLMNPVYNAEFCRAKFKESTNISYLFRRSMLLFSICL